MPILFDELPLQDRLRLRGSSLRMSCAIESGGRIGDGVASGGVVAIDAGTPKASAPQRQLSRAGGAEGDGNVGAEPVLRAVTDLTEVRRLRARCYAR